MSNKKWNGCSICNQKKSDKDKIEDKYPEYCDHFMLAPGIYQCQWVLNGERCTSIGKYISNKNYNNKKYCNYHKAILNKNNLAQNYEYRTNEKNFKEFCLKNIKVNGDWKYVGCIGSDIIQNERLNSYVIKDNRVKGLCFLAKPIKAA